MDEVDKQILRVLEDNGRMSYAELGRRLDLTRVSIRERIVKLQKKGIIEKLISFIISPINMNNLVTLWVHQ